MPIFTPTLYDVTDPIYYVASRSGQTSNTNPNNIIKPLADMWFPDSLRIKYDYYPLSGTTLVEDQWDSLPLYGLNVSSSGFLWEDILAYGGKTLLTFADPVEITYLKLSVPDSLDRVANPAKHSVRLFFTDGGSADLVADPTLNWGDVGVGVYPARNILARLPGDTSSTIDTSFLIDCTGSEIQWNFPLAEVEAVWIGGGGADENRVSAFYRLELDVQLTIADNPFWTNFRSQYEV